MGKVQLEGHKLMYHVDEVSKWLKGEDVAPIYVEIGPTSVCNHQCCFCAFDYLKNRCTSIDKDVLIRNLKDMAKFGVKSIMFCGEGEPLAYAPLAEVIEKAKEFGIDVAITSNGVLLTEEKSRAILKNISWIKFSVDAGSSGVYAEMHGTKEEDFDILLKNMKFACKYKKENKLSCAIGCQMVVIDKTLHEVEKLVKKVKDLSLDYLVLKPYVTHPSSINQQALTMRDYENILLKVVKKYNNKNFRIIFRRQTFRETEKEALEYDVCYGINFMGLIDACGNVFPCSVFYEQEDFYFGNIYDKTFSEIWKSERRKEIVKEFYKKGSKNCRNHCRLNFINKYLDVVKNRNKVHVNFI